MLLHITLSPATKHQHVSVLYYWVAAIKLRDECISGEYQCTGQDNQLYVGKSLEERMKRVSEVSHAVVFLSALFDEK